MSNYNLRVLNYLSSNRVRFGWTVLVGSDHPVLACLDNGVCTILNVRERVISAQLQIKRFGTPWVRGMIVNRSVVNPYRRGFIAIGNLPRNRDFIARMVVRTNFGRVFVYPNLIFNTTGRPKPPKDVVAQQVGEDSIDLSWDLNNDIYTLSSVNVLMSVDNGANWVSFPASTDSVGLQLTGLKTNQTYIFKVSVTSQTNISAESTVTNPIFLPKIVDVDNVLFDKSVLDLYPEPWKSHLEFAMNEWEKFIKVNPAIARFLNDQDPNYQGVKVDLLTANAPTAPWNGYFDPNSARIIKVLPPAPAKMKFLPIYGVIVFNIGKSLPDAEIRQVLVHELGHLLGIGYWNKNILSSTQSDLSLAPDDTTLTLDGLTYKNLSESYREFIGQTGPSLSVTKIPLEHRYDYANNVGHFASVVNSANNLTPVPQDIMSYGHLLGGIKTRITPISISALLDIGAFTLSDNIIEMNQQVILSYDPINGDVYANSLPVMFNGQRVNWYVTGRPQWEIVAADIINGVKTVVWRDTINGAVLRWKMTNRWERIPGEDYAYAGLNTELFYQTENIFATDLNKDGVVGRPTGPLPSIQQLIQDKVSNTEATEFESSNPNLYDHPEDVDNAVPSVVRVLEITNDVEIKEPQRKANGGFSDVDVIIQSDKINRQIAVVSSTKIVNSADEAIDEINPIDPCAEKYYCGVIQVADLPSASITVYDCIKTVAKDVPEGLVAYDTYIECKEHCLPYEPSPTEPVTPSPTEPVTPSPTEPETSSPTEPVTSSPTEPETSSPTEPETEEPL
jgi:hypothetical protein